MSLQHDSRIVLTLDAGGTTFVYNAVQGGRELLEPLRMPSHGDDLPACLEGLCAGFGQIHEATGKQAVAISFAFPGPADYAAGIIGDLGNLPAFRGGVALGPMLADRFGLPVFLNNDGDLFAYGEALGGLLPEVNAQLEAAGSPKRYRNLLGFTFGTGFGGGLVHDGRLVRGDNGAAGEVWLLRHRDHRDAFAEEGVSIRAVRRVYAGLAKVDLAAVPEPKALAELAAKGDGAAREAFATLGRVAGDAIAHALTLFDGLVVLGGGLSGAAPHFLPSLLAELNGQLHGLSGGTVDRLELKAFDLEDSKGLAAFLAGDLRQVAVPGLGHTVPYDPLKRTGVGLSRLGTNAAVSLGAYAFALSELDRS
jgi:glucokinase